MLLAAYLPLLLPAQNPSLPPSLPPIHVQWGEAAEALRGCSHPGKCWLMMGSLGHSSTSREHVRDCMHGQALRGHCASCGQPRGGCMRSVISRGGASMHRRGHPRMGGSVYRRGHRGALHARCEARPVGTRVGGRSPVTPRPSPQRRSPRDPHLPPPPARCGSARSGSGRRGRAARGGGPGPGPPNGSGGPARPRRRPLKTRGAAAAQSSARPRALPAPASTP